MVWGCHPKKEQICEYFRSRAGNQLTMGCVIPGSLTEPSQPGGMVVLVSAPLIAPALSAQPITVKNRSVQRER